MLWIQAPLHDGFQNNDQGLKFNTAMEDVVKFHSNQSTLHLKKESARFTSEGYKAYWEVVDHTVHYFDTIMLKKHKNTKDW